jgi:hypothetical protein
MKVISTDGSFVPVSDNLLKAMVAPVNFVMKLKSEIEVTQFMLPQLLTPCE